MLSDWTRLSMSPGAFIPFGLTSLVISHGPSGAAGAQAGGPGADLAPGGAARAFILTPDTMPAIYVLRLLLTAKANVLVSGPSGAEGGCEGWLPLVGCACVAHGLLAVRSWRGGGKGRLARPK
jgi:hypothetical protein